MKTSLFSLALVAAFAVSPVYASELHWGDGTSQIQKSISTGSYGTAKDIRILLMNDPLHRDDLFWLDTHFALGEYVDASLFLSRIAYTQHSQLFVDHSDRVTHWPVFNDRLSELESYVAANPSYTPHRLVLGYYLLLTGMSNRAERILERIPRSAPEYPVAEFLLGKLGSAYTPYEPPVEPYELPSLPKEDQRRMRLGKTLGVDLLFGFGSIALQSGDISTNSPMFQLRAGRSDGLRYGIVLQAAPQLLTLENNVRKEFSYMSGGFDVSYVQDLFAKALVPEIGLSLQASRVNSLATGDSFGIQVSGLAGVRYNFHDGPGLYISAEGRLSRMIAGDVKFPNAKETWVQSSASVGLSF